MFEVKEFLKGFACCIQDEHEVSLHSDGRVFTTAEYFPTKEDAQAILDKFYPKPKYILVHGDVFKSSSGVKCMYVHLKMAGCEPWVFSLDGNAVYHDKRMDSIISNAKFLYNIQEKL